MASNIIEFFGYAPTDQSIAAVEARRTKQCPFIGGTCQKTLSDGSISGACTLKPVTSGPVICCPIRLYANNYRILADVAETAFGPNTQLVAGEAVHRTVLSPDSIPVAVFGKKWGKELRLPTRGQSGSYFVDWILARLDQNLQLQEFVAVEVQSIDTTGNYQAERNAYLQNQTFGERSTAGFNWENVNKRILPQIIYKGHVLRRERLCQAGLFFVCPTPVYNKAMERLGGRLYEYRLQPGSLTFMWYDVGNPVSNGQVRSLNKEGTFTTTVDQVALAFTSPSNLPDENVYEKAIRAELEGR